MARVCAIVEGGQLLPNSIHPSIPGSVCGLGLIESHWLWGHLTQQVVFGLVAAYRPIIQYHGVGAVPNRCGSTCVGSSVASIASAIPVRQRRGGRDH